MDIRSAVRLVGSGAKDFGKGLFVLLGKPPDGKGDRKLAKMCTIVEAQIPIYGKNSVRTQMIRSAESDLRRAARKGSAAVDSLLAGALATPEYVALCRKLGLDEPHLRVLAMEAKKKYAK